MTNYHHAHHLVLPLLTLTLAVSQQSSAQRVCFNESKEISGARLGLERVAPGFLPVYTASGDNLTKWVQIDLGREYCVDCVKLLPSSMLWGVDGFPHAYRIEGSLEPDFTSPILIADNDLYPDHHRQGFETVTFDSKAVRCRYVRLTATRLPAHTLCLSRIIVMSEGKIISTGCAVSDSENTAEANRALLTATPRPMGDYVVTDYPENVIPKKRWKPVGDKVNTPLNGITLLPGLFKTAMDNNINYLLNSFPAEDLVRNFKLKAGLPVKTFNAKYNRFWMRQLPGSEAGRFLMGAGNTLRWTDCKPLRDELDYIVSVIDSCKEPDGWCMAYQKHETFNGEYGAYTRSWLTHGLIDAGLSGNRQALLLLRGFYDYLDHSPFLPEMLRRCAQGTQGVIPFTRTYFSPVGKAIDLEVVMRYFQQNFFIEKLAQRDPSVIWRYPYDRPHNYLLTAIEPYLDLYRATGVTKYLDAVRGAWDLFHDYWEMPGGEMSINEGNFLYEPKSYWLHKEAGELCGNAFWIKINQRFHNLYPDEEKYMTEIEKSIYNVCIANQYGSYGYRYFARLDGQKDREHDAGYGFAENTCCEGQGTRIIGSLPEYMYSFAPDGLYINLYGASQVTMPLGRDTLRLDVKTAFPYSPDVTMIVTASTQARLHLRIPSWATAPVTVRINGDVAAQGRPGSYVSLNRQWQRGDLIEMTLPMGFRLTPYIGKEPGFGPGHYAVEYGPLLMAAVAVRGKHGHVWVHADGQTLVSRLRPIPGNPLHFAIQGDSQYELWPYFEVQEEPFSCFAEYVDNSLSNR